MLPLLGLAVAAAAAFFPGESIVSRRWAMASEVRGLWLRANRSAWSAEKRPVRRRTAWVHRAPALIPK